MRSNGILITDKVFAGCEMDKIQKHADMADEKITLAGTTSQAIADGEPNVSPDGHERMREILDAFLGDGTSIEPEQLFRFAARYEKLMLRYRCAVREITTKLEVLNDELSSFGGHSPIETIRSRIKRPYSIARKLRRMGLPAGIEEISGRLNDVAGVRVICPFISDIYRISEMLLKQDDITLVSRKDYISEPKPNGYRSLHLIVEVPVFFSCEKLNVRVEIQIRTVAMDFWASLEHELRYKNDSEQAQQISQELKMCADVIAQTDAAMQRLRDRVNAPCDAAGTQREMDESMSIN